ncbi:MAG: hypothetical protein ACYC6O_07585 [Thermoleophilia bacterium]
MMKRTQSLETKLDERMYPAAEAGRLVGMSSSRVRRWLQGYSYEYESRIYRQRPVINRSTSSDDSYASFLDLVDLLFAKRFLEYGVSLQKLRRALDEASQILNTKHFARRSFFTDGRKIYLEVKEEGNAILQLLSGGQWVIPRIIKDLAHQIDFDQNLELARRWYPRGREGLIVLDPLFSFGRPSIVGKGIATANIYDFFVAEYEMVRPVCRWFDLNQLEVKAAVAFEQELAA